jgi:hypothetical protein
VRAFVLATLLSFASACTAEPRAPASVGTSAASSAGSGASSTPPSSTDDDCGLDSTRAHPEPLALVREFVERDGRGEFARGSTWLSGAVLCPEHLPGPDAFVAIDTMEVLTGAAVVTADSARVPVRYALLGEASPLRFDAAPSVVVDTFLVARTSYGWRVVSPDMPMRIRAAVAAGWSDVLPDSVRTALRAAASSTRAAR